MLSQKHTDWSDCLTSLAYHITQQHYLIIHSPLKKITFVVKSVLLSYNILLQMCCILHSISLPHTIASVTVVRIQKIGSSRTWRLNMKAYYYWWHVIVSQ